ncbi:MAG: hypothetical protein NTW79_00810 [Candidatus Berkelbacteria bacterium]|nr:hypothetical protein [Candidatus Berkelbacteria bacterium]
MYGNEASLTYDPKISDKYMVDGSLVILLDSLPGGLGQAAVKMDPATGKVLDVRAGDVAVPGF